MSRIEEAPVGVRGIQGDGISGVSSVMLAVFLGADCNFASLAAVGPKNVTTCK